MIKVCPPGLQNLRNVKDRDCAQNRPKITQSFLQQFQSVVQGLSPAAFHLVLSICVGELFWPLFWPSNLSGRQI